MRFYKVIKDTIDIGFNQILQKGEVLCLSRYYNGIVVVATSNSRTKFPLYYPRAIVELFRMDSVEKLTPQELNKIRPHLTKKMLQYDMD